MSLGRTVLIGRVDNVIMAVRSLADNYIAVRVNGAEGGGNC